MPRFMVNSYRCLKDEEGKCNRFRLHSVVLPETKRAKEMNVKLVAKLVSRELPRKTVPKKPTDEKSNEQKPKNNESTFRIHRSKSSPKSVVTQRPETAHNCGKESEPEVVPKATDGTRDVVPGSTPKSTVSPQSRLKFPYRKASIRRSNKTKAPFHVVRNPDIYVEMKQD